MPNTRVMADGQEMDLGKSQPVMAIIHPTDMVIEAPDHVKIGPEETVACSNDLEQDQWEFIRVNENFLKAWGKIMKEAEPPLVLKKSSLGTRHIVGMVLLAVSNPGKKLFFELPETYLHPQQAVYLMIFLRFITGQKD